MKDNFLKSLCTSLATEQRKCIHGAAFEFTEKLFREKEKSLELLKTQ